MKRKLTILTAALALLMALGIPLTGWGQERDEAVYSTCLFGASYNSQSVNNYTSTWTATNGGFTWTIVNGNNNANGWSYVKFGRKNNASIGQITTAAAYSEAITAVTITIDAINIEKVNSIKLYTSSNNSSWTEAGSFSKEAGEKTVTLASPTANLYYKIEFDCASGSSNGLVTVSKVEYFYNEGGGVTPTAAAPTFSPAAGAYTSAQNVTISTTTEGATIYYTTDGTDPTTSSSVYSTAIPVNATTTIKAMAVKSGYNNSPVASATYNIVSIEHAGTLADPYTVADARNAIDANVGVTGVYATGIVSKIVTAYNATYSNITFNISTDGTTTSDQLQAYRCTGTDAENVVVGATVVVSGDLTKYGSNYEFAEGCELVSLTPPANPYILANNFSIAFNATSGSFDFTVNNPVTGGTTTVSENVDWISDAVITGNTVTFNTTVNNGTSARQGVITLTYSYNSTSVTKNVTVTQGAQDYAELPVVFDGKKADLPFGFTNNGLGSDYSTSPYLKFDTKDDNLVLKTNKSATKLVFDIKGYGSGSDPWAGVFKVQTSADGVTYTDLKVYSSSSEAGQETLPSSTATKSFTLASDVRYIRWYYTAKTTGNVALGYIRVTDNDLDIFTDTTLENLNIGAGQYCTVYPPAVLNVTGTLTNQATENDWDHLVIKDGAQLKTPNTVYGTVEKNITGYGTSTKDKYYLLATPATMDACNNTGMWPNETTQHVNVDFYSFDQTYPNEEWRNYKYGNAVFAGPIAFIRGQGYLYANKNDVTLTLQTRGYVAPGMSAIVEFPFKPTNVDTTVTLSYAENANFKGFNLIGNPYTCKAYLAGNRSFYRMNPAGNTIVAATAGSAIDVCEGIFVVAADADDNSVTFTTTAPTTTTSALNLNLTQATRGEAELIDAAIVRFDDCQMLPKFYFMDNTSGLFIPQGNKDYAVVRSNAQGELPVSFKAAENGSYTLSVNPENVTMNYLHLIDNMTGANIDLLANPSYTFNANTNDYASRFRLVFSANANVNENSEAAETTFAYNNGSEWVVANEGEATLQVIDVLGRQLSSEKGHSEFRIPNSAFSTPGVYVLRLVNGDSVRTQKVVVR